MNMRIDLDAKVQTRDGEDAGRVERAIFDPESNTVKEFVVDTGGLLGRMVLVPAAEIEGAGREGEVLRLRLGKTALDRMPTYVPEQYIPPPAGWMPPVGLGFPDGAYLWPGAVIPPAPAPTQPEMVVTPARAAGPAAGLETTADSRSQTHVVRPYEGEVSLSHGAAVVDREGNDLGVVDEVRIDTRTNAVQGFTLRVGGLLRTLFGGGDKVEVTRSQIDHVSEGVVHLRLTKEELERLARGTETAV